MVIKSLVSLGSFLVVLMSSSTPVWALSYFSCRVESVSKVSARDVRSYEFVIRRQVTNRLEIYHSQNLTTLDIKVDANGNLDGMVNGQRNFILKGHFKDGEFESAYARGTIRCDDEKMTKVLYFFKPWKQWYALGGGGILDTVNLDKYGYLCYEGDSKQVLIDVKLQDEDQTRWFKQPELSPKGRISAYRMEKECLEGEGNPDEYECYHWDEPRAVEYFLDSCDAGLEQDRP